MKEDEETVLSLWIGDSELENILTDGGTRDFLCAVESSVGVLRDGVDERCKHSATQ